MKDVTVQGSSIVREIRIWLLLLVAAFLTNIYAIISYNGQWVELFTQWHVVLILSVVFYVFLWIIRGLVRGVLFIIRGSSSRAGKQV